MFDKSTRRDGTYSRADFAYDADADSYACPAGKPLHRRRRKLSVRWAGMPVETINYRASKTDCGVCPLKQRCCPNEPMRRVTRSIHEAARDKAHAIAKIDAYVTSRRQRKKVEMLFAHLKCILKLDRLCLLGPNGANDEFLLAATAQNLSKLAKLISETTLKPA